MSSSYEIDHNARITGTYLDARGARRLGDSLNSARYQVNDPRGVHFADRAISREELMEYLRMPKYEISRFELPYKGRDEANSSLDNVVPIPVEQFGKYISYGNN